MQRRSEKGSRVLTSNSLASTITVFVRSPHAFFDLTISKPLTLPYLSSRLDTLEDLFAALPTCLAVATAY